MIHTIIVNRDLFLDRLAVHMSGLSEPAGVCPMLPAPPTSFDHLYVVPVSVLIHQAPTDYV